MDIPIWGYIVAGILGVVGFVSLMWFSYFHDKQK